jgi:hypothetical protein
LKLCTPFGEKVKTGKGQIVFPKRPQQLLIVRKTLSPHEVIIHLNHKSFKITQINFNRFSCSLSSPFFVSISGNCSPANNKKTEEKKHYKAKRKPSEISQFFFRRRRVSSAFGELNWMLELK